MKNLGIQKEEDSLSLLLEINDFVEVSIQESLKEWKIITDKQRITLISSLSEKKELNIS